MAPADTSAASADTIKLLTPIPMTKTVQVNCHWACGRVQTLEFDHWPQRDELPAEAVRFDIAWPDPAAEPRAMTAAEMRYAAAHDTSCVGAFARARP